LRTILICFSLIFPDWNGEIDIQSESGEVDKNPSEYGDRAVSIRVIPTKKAISPRLEPTSYQAGISGQSYAIITIRYQFQSFIKKQLHFSKKRSIIFITKRKEKDFPAIAL